MSRVIKFAKGVRNHWKKSIFAAGAISYGVKYGIEQYQIHQLMIRYCQEAKQYGEVPHSAQKPFNKVLVLLNPAADKRSAAATFESYCAPILHIAGVKIDVVKTDSEGHARRYIEELDTLPDAILVAGGDGTISETITGLLRRTNTNEKPPTIGVLPIGRTNDFAANVFKISGESKIKKVEGIANATISIVRGKVERKDVMQIQLLATDSQPVLPKPVYAVGKLQWGAYRDAYEKRDGYWYFGPLREYVTFLFNAFSDSLTWNCTAKLLYTDPCKGCSNCFIKQQSLNAGGRRWWTSFIPSFRLGSSNHAPDYSKIVNINCSKTTELEVQPSDILLTLQKDDEQSKISVKLGNGYRGFDFITDSWKRLQTKGFEPLVEYSVRTVEILPENVSSEENEKYFSIDNEAFEVKPIKVTLLPNAVNFYVL